MNIFTLHLTKQGAWTGVYQWSVEARQEYSLSTDMINPKLDDTLFTDVLVERTIQGKKVSAKVDPSKFFELVEVAYQIRIPLIGVDFPVGDDGTDYEVTFRSLGNGSVKLEWWSHYPEEWEPMTKWFREMTRFLDDAIENQAL